MLEFYFNEKVTDFEFENNKIKKLEEKRVKQENKEKNKKNGYEQSRN